MDLLGPNFTKDIIKLFTDGMISGVNLAWSWFISILIEDWKFFMTAYFIIFFISTLKAMIGRWGALGSILYNTFYFGTLFILGLIFGPQIFIDDVFKMTCIVILYPICYLLVGLILDKIREY